jgi:DNA gyrase subunit A
MKKQGLAFLLLGTFLLTGCNKPPKMEKVQIMYKYSNLTEVINIVDDENQTALEQLELKITDKENFVLVSYADYTCSCWSVFRDHVLRNYINTKKIPIYVIETDALGNDFKGLPIRKDLTNTPVIGIFAGGVCKYSIDYTSKSEIFIERDKFNEWMDARIKDPLMTYISLEEVNTLLKATDNIDEIVSIIKNSESGEEASQKLMERFLFSEIQTREVLGMTLRRLTGLEIDKLNKEREQLLANIERYRLILSARDHMVDVVLEELEEIKAKYGDERRTEISDDLADIDNEDLIPVEDIVVMLTNQGYIKRVDPEEFRTIKRGGVGVKGMRTKEEEIIDIILHTNTHTDVLFFTSKGKVYRKRGYQIPQYRREGKGLPVINLLNIEKEEAVRAIVSTDTYGEDHYLLYVTRNGVTKRTTLAEFSRINVSGKIAIDLREGDELMDVKITDGTAIIGIGSSNGKMASFYETDVRAMGRTAAGVRGIKLDEGAYVVGVTTSLEGALIFALTTKGYGKLTPANDYRLTKRGSKGVITIKESERTGTLAGIRAIKGDEDLFVTTASGMVVRTNFKEISTTSRNTMGVRVIRLRPDDVVSSFAVVEKGIAFDEDDHEGEGTPSHEE